jgi:hypothetical protein
VAGERGHHRVADLLVADPGERGDRDRAPNSSAIAVRTHGIASWRAAHAVAYVLCVCTIPLTSGISR